MPKDFLDKIVEEKKRLNAEKQPFFDSLKKTLGRGQSTRYHLFKRMISNPGQMNLIAEIKKASPSRGILREEFDILEIAKIYVENKAAAISILTEEKYFLGKPMYVKKVADQFNVPILTKDFIIHEGQILEARFHGASAVLLIMALLNHEQCQHLMGVADTLGLDCLIEVHNAEELERALDLSADIIGINNRDLKTFVVDLKISEQLIPKIPEGKVIVAESGITSNKEVEWLKDLGAHAVLIGETFMRAEDIGKKLNEVMNN